MSEPKWTPGPWEWANDEVFEVDGNNSICVVLQRLPVAKANARLIAAAPDLAEALERCLAYIESDEMAHGRQFGEGNVARAALARAKGTEE